MAGALQTHKPPSGPSAAQSLEPSSGIVVLFCCAASQTGFKAFDVSPSGCIYIVINIFTLQKLPDIRHDGYFYTEEKKQAKLESQVEYLHLLMFLMELMTVEFPKVMPGSCWGGFC